MNGYAFLFLIIIQKYISINKLPSQAERWADPCKDKTRQCQVKHQCTGHTFRFFFKTNSYNFLIALAKHSLITFNCFKHNKCNKLSLLSVGHNSKKLIRPPKNLPGDSKAAQFLGNI